MDKSFGFFFGIFKGYVFAVCLFVVVNWFYSYEKWDMSLNKSLSFPLVEKGKLLIEEFPSGDDIKETKEKLKKFKSNPIREECGVFGIHNFTDASTITALGLHALQHRGQEGCGIVSFDGINFHSEKRHGLVGDNFTNKDILKNYLENLL